MIRLALLLVLIIFIITLILRGIKIVLSGEVMIIERLGAYLSTLREGMSFIIPIIDAPKSIPWQFLEKDKNGNIYCVVKNIDRIPLRENIFYLLKHPIFKEDHSKIELDVLVYFIIEDPCMATYNVASLPKAFEKIIISALKNKSTEDESLQGYYSEVQNKLLETLCEEAKKFGVKINKVELENIK